MKDKHPESPIENVKEKKNFVDLGVKFSCDICQYQGQTQINLSLHKKEEFMQSVFFRTEIEYLTIIVMLFSAWPKREIQKL